MKRRLIACLLMLCLVLGASAFWRVQKNAGAAGAYNTVRVKITTNESASISISVGENYRIAQDVSIILTPGTYTVANVSGSIRISNSSFSKTVGATLTLERCQSTNLNTIVLYNTRYSCNIAYLGNMNFVVQGSGVRVINTVPLEQYLYGVVGYEMSNAFPVEALKAQAVVARGYAISAIAPSSQYDLVDTSADQVYRGYPSGQENVKAAVDATSGQVLMYNGAICETYFSASNGGKTELPGNAWGGGASKNAAYPYLAQKDDPYDLENQSSLSYRIYVPKLIRNTSMDPVADLPSSGVTYQVQIVDLNYSCSVYSTASTAGSVIGVANKDAKFTFIADSGEFYKIDYNGTSGYIVKEYGIKIPDTSVQPTNAKPSLPVVYTDAVLNDLQNKAYTVMKARGDSVPDATNIRLMQVTDFRNGQARYTTGSSNCFVSADADLVVQYIDNEGTVVNDALVTVSIVLMNKDTDGSYLLTHAYLNDNCRMRFVEATEDGFDIVNRRYGHGVGMSQRGAQQMALNGKDSGFILAFYFDGSAVSAVDTTIPALPAAMPTPTGMIVRIQCTNYVNVRAQASTSSTDLGDAKNGAEYPHLGTTGTWYIILFDNRVAYVSTSYATLITPTPTPVVTPTPTPTEAPAPTPTAEPTPTAVPTPTPATTQVIRIKVGTSVNVRKTASTSALSLGKAYNNETYAYLGKSGSFWIINYKGQTGYVYSTYGVLTTISASPTAAPTPTPTTAPSAAATATPATTPTPTAVSTQVIRIKVSTSVNVRKTASTSASSLGRAYNNETYAYLGKSGSFWKINYKGQTGYVYSTYGVLTTSSTATTPAPSSSTTHYVSIKVGTYVNVRKTASTSALSLGRAYNNEKYVYLGKSGSFWKINYKGQTGYVYVTYGVYI